MELDTKRIEAAIVAEVSDKMISDNELYERTKRAIDARIDQLWKESADTRIRSEVELAISNGFEREYQRVDEFGRATGAKTTIRAELERLISGYWNQRVDHQGKPTESSYHTVTRAEWMMAKICADDFAGKMKDHVVSVAGGLKDGLRKELYSTVNRLLSDVFHVRSLDDQGKGRERIDPVAKPIGQPGGAQ